MLEQESALVPDLMAYNEKRLGFAAGARRGGLN
jgi:hypothetical protein